MRSTPPPSQSGSAQTTPSPKGNAPPLTYPTQHPSPNQQQQQQQPPQPPPHRDPIVREVPIMHQPPPPHPMHQPPPPQPMPVPQHQVVVPNHGGRPHSHTPPHPYNPQMPPRGGQGPPPPPNGHNGHKPAGQINGEVKSAPLQQGPPQQRPPRNVYSTSTNAPQPILVPPPQMYQEIPPVPKQEAVNCVPQRHREDVKVRDSI